MSQVITALRSLHQLLKPICLPQPQQSQTAELTNSLFTSTTRFCRQAEVTDNHTQGGKRLRKPLSASRRGKRCSWNRRQHPRCQQRRSKVQSTRMCADLIKSAHQHEVDKPQIHVLSASSLPVTIGPGSSAVHPAEQDLNIMWSLVALLHVTYTKETKNKNKEPLFMPFFPLVNQLTSNLMLHGELQVSIQPVVLSLHSFSKTGE